MRNERAVPTKVTIVHSSSITADHKFRHCRLECEPNVRSTPLAITRCVAAPRDTDPRVTDYMMINYDYAGHFAHDHSPLTST